MEAYAGRVQIPASVNGNIKSDKKIRLRQRLETIRRMSQIVTIQAIWRGKLARIRARKLKIDHSYSYSRICQERSEIAFYYQFYRNMVNGKDTVDSNRFGKLVSFQSHLWLNFSLQHGINFPLCCTVSRVVLRVVDEYYKDLTEVTHHICDLKTDFLHPTFHWTVKLPTSDLSRDALVILRLDTLERPSMRFKCVGYSIFRLCLYHLDKDIWAINTGHFLLQICYGNFPKGRFTDGMIKTMTPLKDSFLYVSMTCDATSSTVKSKCELSTKTHCLCEVHTNNASSSIAHTLQCEYSNDDSIIPDQIKAIKQASRSDCSSIKNIISEQFPWLIWHDSNRVRSVAKVLLDGVGSSNDCDLPPIPETSAIAKLKGRSSVEVPSTGMTQQISRSSLTQCDRAIDISDLSESEQRRVLESLTQWLTRCFQLGNPKKHISVNRIRHYNADMGLRIGIDELHNMPTRVIPVVSTESKITRKLQLFKCYVSLIPAQSSKDDEYGRERTNHSATDQVDVTLEMDAASTELCPRFLDKPSSFQRNSLNKSSSLLIRVYAVDVCIYRTQKGRPPRMSVYRNACHNWWGLLPLLVPSPFENNLQLDAINSASSDDSFNLFVNVGTHIVPLMEGLPPKHIMQSKNPLEDMKTELCKSYHSAGNTNTGLTCLTRLFKSQDERKLAMSCRLSDGASAIVRIIDGQFPELGNSHIFEDAFIAPSTEAMNDILRAAVTAPEDSVLSKPARIRLESLQQQFAYQSLRSDHRQSVAELCSELNPRVLLSKVNELCSGLECQDTNNQIFSPLPASALSVQTMSK